MSGRRLERTALRLVPREWRDEVARDVGSGAAPGARRWLAILRIGLEIRTARVRDRLATMVTGSGVRKALSIAEFARDLRLGARHALRRPATSLAIIATLATGIGANAAIYSLFNWILFRPLPGAARPADLVTIRFLTRNSDGRFFVAYRDYADLRDGVPALASLTASAPLSLNVASSGSADPERVDGEIVTSSYFDVLGVRPRIGRTFAGADVPAAGASAEAVIAEAFWRRWFGADPGIVGRQFYINGRPFTVIGVVPGSFMGRSALTATAVWVPVAAHQPVLPAYGGDITSGRRPTLFGDVIGRLQPNTTAEQVEEQARAVAAHVQDFGGRGTAQAASRLLPTVFPGVGLDTFARTRLTTIFKLLMGSVGLVLLLACANAANLLVARSLQRARDVAISRAVGATAWRIFRQQLAEGLVLAAAAGAGGLLLAQALTWLFDGVRLVTYLPAAHGVSLDWRVCVFTAAVALLTGVIFALAPAFVSSRIDLQRTLKDGQTSARRSRRALRGSLVAVQVAISIVLLVGCGLFVRSLRNIHALDLGFNPTGLTVFSVDPTRAGYEAARRQAYFRDAVARLRATPGIDSAASTWNTPYSMMRSENGFRRVGSAAPETTAARSQVSAGYFRTMGIPLLAGRDFTDADGVASDTSGAIIVSQRFAREMFPDGGAVGSRLALAYPKGKVVEVIGVVGDVRGRPITDDPEPFVYDPAPIEWGSIVVRSALPGSAVAAAIRSVIRSLDPMLPPYDLEPMTAGVDRALSEQRLFAQLSVLFAVMAVGLAAVGVYAVLAAFVAERRREFGIRIALGAGTREILHIVTGTSARLCAVGAAAGAFGALLSGRALESRLYGVHANDPLMLGAAITFLLIVALVASVVPSLRAARVDPIRSLRAD